MLGVHPQWQRGHRSLIPNLYSLPYTVLMLYPIISTLKINSMVTITAKELLNQFCTAHPSPHPAHRLLLARIMFTPPLISSLPFPFLSYSALRHFISADVPLSLSISLFLSFFLPPSIHPPLYRTFLPGEKHTSTVSGTSTSNSLLMSAATSYWMDE